MAIETTTTKAVITNTPAAALATADVSEPIIIDLGKKKRKLVRKLRKGKEGRLMNKIQDVLAEAMAAKAIPSGAQPVLVIVREKKKKAKYGKMWGLG